MHNANNGIHLLHSTYQYCVEFLKTICSTQTEQFQIRVLGKIRIRPMIRIRDMHGYQGFGAGAARSRGIWLEPEPSLWPGSGSTLNIC